jgi:hypothetical protein
VPIITAMENWSAIMPPPRRCAEHAKLDPQRFAGWLVLHSIEDGGMGCPHPSQILSNKM